MVTYPGTLTPLAVGQERSIRLIDEVLSGDRALVMVASKDPELEEPGPDAARAGRRRRRRRAHAQGARRDDPDPRPGHAAGRASATSSRPSPYLVARISELPDVVEDGPELQALTRNVQRTFSEIIEQIPYLPEELQLAVTNVEDPSALAHLIAGALRISTAEKQEILEQVDVVARLRRLSEILARELEVISLGTQIQSQVQEGIDKGQREYYLREQLRAIQEELGEGDEQQAEVNELRERIEAAGLPEQAQKAADRELGRLERLPPAAAEYGVIRTYLDWMLDLPWNERTEDDLDMPHAREVLDADHYDLEKVKDRILEYLAVRKLNPDSAGPILCFVGPPGVGKTSLGRSIARALGRKFERISVGGVRDEAEIRGHRRTYVGAMPGTIVRALRDAGSRNPVFMIDEIDKMGADFRGDPASAMLEVLDPSQNDSFRDHYLDLDFDLSEVIFIATANVLDPIPPPLRDRMEVIDLSGYTVDEKLHIARRYLVPRQLGENGLKASQVDVLRRRAAGDHRGVHARGRGPQPRAPDRHRLPQARPRGRRGQAEGGSKRADDLRQAGPRAARPPAGLLRGAPADQPARRRHRPRLDPGRRRGAVHRGDVDARLGPADDHRPARRRDEGVGAGRALARCAAAPPSSSPTSIRPGSRPTTSTCTCPPARSPRTGPSAGVAMVDRAGLAAQRPAGPQRRRDDRRDHADRPGPAGRRPEGEVARRAAGRDQAGDRARPQRGRDPRDPRARAQRARVRLRRRDRGGAGGGAGARGRRR